MNASLSKFHVCGSDNAAWLPLFSPAASAPAGDTGPPGYVFFGKILPARSLANKGHDTRAIQGWLGHRSITSTAVYTALAPNRFKDFWRD
jgi:hypothetical protein